MNVVVYIGSSKPLIDWAQNDWWSTKRKEIDEKFDTQQGFFFFLDCVNTSFFNTSTVFRINRESYSLQCVLLPQDETIN